MKRFLLTLALILALVTGTFSDNTHQTGNPQTELGYWFGQAMPPFVASQCLPSVPASSLTFAAFACSGYVQGSSGQLIYVSQPAATLTLPNTTGNHWIAIHSDTSTVVSGWSRRSGSHYLFKQVTVQPPNPSGGLVVAEAVVSGGIITTVIDRRQPASYVQSGMANVKDPLYGALGDNSANDAPAFQAAINSGLPITVPVGTYKIGATLTNTSPTRIDGPFGPFLGGTQGALLKRTFNGSLFDIRGPMMMSNLLLDDDGGGAGARTGAALYLAANYDGSGNVFNNQTPNSSQFSNVRITSTNGDIDAWQYLVWLDGSGGFASGTLPPLRRILFLHCQLFGGRTTHKSVWLNRVAHVAFTNGFINPAGSAVVGGFTIDDTNTADVNFVGFEMIGNAVINDGVGIGYVGGRMGVSNITTSLTIGASVTGAWFSTLILGDVINSAPDNAGVIYQNPVRNSMRISNALQVDTRRDNYLTIIGNNTGGPPSLSTDGLDTNAGLVVRSKGTGLVGVNTTSGSGTGGFQVGDGSGIPTFIMTSDGYINKLSNQTVQIRAGTGSPEAVVLGNVGALYLRVDGGAGTSLYVKESGNGTNTGWIAK